ncbi:hypothetical protein [Opitutus sp. ER46]|uniref:hypothetical protein n=1 Tax=Opitutus sp. ER46 TaxID=2161864 RepID=UPI000D31FEE1|nr:hypothetical protein [Opitutus sp. ER46]PTX91097.1 hypothetical protein DB354_20900 [Opitutus sp. ER46]
MSNDLKFRIGRLVAAVQRNRPYRLRRAIGRFDPIRSGSGSTTLLIMVEARKFWDAMWSAWSWMRFLEGRCRLQIAVDGEFSTAQCSLLQRQFPGLQIDFCPALRGDGGRLAEYCRQHQFGRKVAAILNASVDGNVLYSDSDVLALREPSEVMAAVSSGTAMHIVDSWPQFDPTLLARTAQLGLPHIPDLNSGLMVIPRNASYSQFLTAVIDDWAMSDQSRFAEQTLFSVLLRHLGARPLPPAHYTCSFKGAWYWEREISYAVV